MYNKRHKSRNATNRNVIVIAVGFLATFMAVGFIYQSYVAQWNAIEREHSILFKIEDTTGILAGKKFDLYLFDSIIYSDTLQFKNQEYLHTTPCKKEDQVVTIFFHDIAATASEHISVADTGTTYLMLKVLKTDSVENMLRLRKFNF